MSLRRVSLALLALTGLVGLLWLSSAGGAYAQTSDRVNPVLEGPCRDDPNGEACVCRHLREFDTAGLSDQQDILREHRMDVFRELEPDEFVKTRKYRYLCSMSYLRENIRRGWSFVVLLAAGLASVSMVWCGFVYAQETSSGEQRATARLLLIRVIIGVLLVAMAYLAWDVVNGFFFAGSEGWNLDGDVFYDLDELRQGREDLWWE